MIAALLLQGADAAPVPADWSALAPLPYVSAPAMLPTFGVFVAGEIADGRCAVPRPADGHYTVRVEIAALVAADGTVRRTLPHAIACPTVEQYAAGLVQGFARGNLLMRVGVPDRWYRTSIVFEWRG